MGRQLETDSAVPVTNFVKAVREEVDRSDPDSAIARLTEAVLQRVQSAGDMRSVFWADRFALGVQGQPDAFEIDAVDAEVDKLAQAEADADTIVIYVNGLNTTHLEAVIDSQVLRSTLSGESSAQRVPGIKSVMFWNRSSTERDFYCPVLFANPQLASACTLVADGFDHGPVIAVLSSTLDLPPGAILHDLPEAAVQWAADALDLDTDPAGQLPDLIQWIQTAIVRGKRVVLVPHSQGNFLVKAALQRIIAEEDEYLNLNVPLWGSNPCDRPYSPHIGVISTGSPIEFGDLETRVAVVQVRGEFLAENLPGAPAGYIDPVDQSLDARQRHNFVGSYMRGPARVVIADLVREFRETLPLPGQMLNINVSLDVLAGENQLHRAMCNDWNEPLSQHSEHANASVTARIDREPRRLHITLDGDLSGTPDHFYAIQASYTLRLGCSVHLEPGQALRITSSGTEHRKDGAIKLTYLKNSPESAGSQTIEFGAAAVIPAETAGDLGEFLPASDPMRFVSRRREIAISAEFVPCVPEDTENVRTQMTVTFEVQ